VLRRQRSTRLAPRPAARGPHLIPGHVFRLVVTTLVGAWVGGPTIAIRG
jgi:hypothetical protein